MLTVPRGDSLLVRQDIQDPNEDEEEDDDIDDRDGKSNDIEYRKEQGFEELDVDGDVSMHVPMQSAIRRSGLGRRRAQRAKKLIKISRYGIEYSSLPSGVVKKLATTFLRTSGNSKAKFSADTLEAIMQASDWFFEQISENLGTYAEHARRKTIDESDVLILMGR